MALACCLLRPAAPRAAAVSCRCRLGGVLAAPPGSWRWGGSLAGGGAAAAAAADHSSPSSSSPSSSSSPAGRGSTALAAAVRDDLLKGVAAENREDVARIVEQAQRAADSWTVVHSDFHTPPVVADAMVVLQRMADVTSVPWGGYPQAERCRLSLGREEALAGAADDPSQLDSVAAVQCRGNFMFDPASHRDFLGACLGTGIERSKVGDIIVTGEQGCQILCAQQLVEHLEAELTQVRTVPVQTQAISLSELQVRAPRVEEISSVEASMRLDAVASAGFRVSRSKMMDLIKAGDVRVNWRSGCKPSSEVKAGDVISVAGKGRLEVRGASRTQKGKYSVQMARFL